MFPRRAAGALAVGAFLALTATRSAPLGVPEQPVYAAVTTVGHNEQIVAGDGNLLFYNGPTAAQLAGETWLGYLTSRGDVILESRHGRRATVYSYRNLTGPDGGTADDHAAPAVWADREQGRLLIATAYHDSDLRVLAYDPVREIVNEIAHLRGRYTYPRFIAHGESIALLLRRQDSAGGRGLVLAHGDEFGDETTIVGASPGTTIYAGLPTSFRGGFLIAYSIQDDVQSRLRGLHLLRYNFRLGAVDGACDLSQLLGQNAFSNRPTGIGFNGKGMIIGTTVTDEANVPETTVYDNFLRTNTVMIIAGSGVDECDQFRVVESSRVAMPYYPTDVAVNDNLEYLYFGADKVHTNVKADGCFEAPRKLYPRFAPSGILYASMNMGYAIRDFHNSLIWCQREVTGAERATRLASRSHLLEHDGP
jgi:hypothetical protein